MKMKPNIMPSISSNSAAQFPSSERLRKITDDAKNVLIKSECQSATKMTIANLSDRIPKQPRKILYFKRSINRSELGHN